MYAFARQKRKQNTLSLFKPWWTRSRSLVHRIVPWLDIPRCFLSDFFPTLFNLLINRRTKMWLNGRACFSLLKRFNRCWTSDFRCCHHPGRKLFDKEVPHITRKSSRTNQNCTSEPILFVLSVACLFVRRSFSFTGLQLIGEELFFPRCGCNTGKDNSARSSNRFIVSEMSSVFCWTNKEGRWRAFSSIRERERGGFSSTSITRQDVWSIGETTSTENFADHRHRHTVESRKKQHHG